MATASKTTETIKVPVTTYREEVKVTGVTLNLTLAEARALKATIGRFGGDPQWSARKYTDQVWYALESQIPSKLDPNTFEGGKCPVCKTWDKDPFA